MIIPKDRGGNWRLLKFIDYHVLGDADMNFPILKKYAIYMKMTVGERFWFAFLYSTCYCVATTCFLFEMLDLDVVTEEELKDFWEEYKASMIFQSDKRYVKNMNWFVPMVLQFIQVTDRNPIRYFKSFKGSPQETYDKLYKTFMGWQYFGRFTVFLLIEAISKLTPLYADSAWFDWKKGDTATSGMMNLLYLDEEAVEFDKAGVLTSEVKANLTRHLGLLKKHIRHRYPLASINITDIETALCGFRKLFKSSRYGGYYIDRVQGEINTMETRMPQYKLIWNKLWEYRKQSFPSIFLGELQGRSGMQKARNKDWVERGVTGVEAIS